MFFLLAMPLFLLPKVTACLRAVAKQDTTMVLSELMVLPAAVALCWVLGWRCFSGRVQSSFTIGNHHSQMVWHRLLGAPQLRCVM